MELELKLDFSSIYMYINTYRVQKGCFLSDKNRHNYQIMYVNQRCIIDGGKLKVRCDLVLFTPVNLCNTLQVPL